MHQYYSYLLIIIRYFNGIIIDYSLLINIIDVFIIIPCII